MVEAGSVGSVFQVKAHLYHEHVNRTKNIPIQQVNEGYLKSVVVTVIKQ